MNNDREFIYFKGRILRKNLIKSAYLGYDNKRCMVRPVVEFINETEPLAIGEFTIDKDEALMVMHELYVILSGNNDIGDEKPEEIVKQI